MTSDRTQFDYLLNAFERASQSDDPSDDEYASKRRALHAYVRDLEARAAPPAPAQPPVAVVTECEACFTPDVCQLRGTCDYYSAEWLRVAPPPAAPEPSDAITDEMVERAFVVIYGGPSDYIFDSGNKYGRAGRSARESALNKVRAALRAAAAARNTNPA